MTNDQFPIIRLLFLGLLFISVLFSNSKSDLDSLKLGLQFFSQKTINIRIKQFQYGQTYNSEAVISFIDSSSYYVSTSEQDILIENDTIKTWNKNINQLVIDLRLPSDNDIFSILTGNINGLSLSKKVHNNGLVTFQFSMIDFGYNGEISLTKSNWQLKSIKIDYDTENWIILNIRDWEWFFKDDTIDNFGASAKTVIDLRE